MEKKVRGGGFAWSAKENLGSIFREALNFYFQVLEGLTSGRQKDVIYFHKIETMDPTCNKRDVEQTEGRTSYPSEHWYRLEFIVVSYINKGGAPSLKCVGRMLTCTDTEKSSVPDNLLAAPTTLGVRGIGKDTTRHIQTHTHTVLGGLNTGFSQMRLCSPPAALTLNFLCMVAPQGQGSSSGLMGTGAPADRQDARADTAISSSLQAATSEPSPFQEAKPGN